MDVNFINGAHRTTRYNGVKITYFLARHVENDATHLLHRALGSHHNRPRSQHWSHTRSPGTPGYT